MAPCLVEITRETMLPPPQAAAASNSISRPAMVTSPPILAATTAMPPKANSAPNNCQRVGRSERIRIAKPMVKKTCNCRTSDDRPALTPSFMPVNRKPNCSAKMSRL